MKNTPHNDKPYEGSSIERRLAHLLASKFQLTGNSTWQNDDEDPKTWDNTLHDIFWHYDSFNWRHIFFGINELGTSPYWAMASIHVDSTSDNDTALVI